MLSKLNKDNRGFTIIEVLIVLAIAGLIMLIVFLAIPALQRNQRNNARNSEASRISAAISECLANRNGQVTSCDTTADINVGTLQQLAMPAATFTAANAAGTDLVLAADDTETNVTWAFQRRCVTAGDNDEPGGTRDFALLYRLENDVNRCIGSQAN